MAIAFDAARDTQIVNPGTSLTFSHTCGTGSDRILFVGSLVRTNNCTGVTYGGVAMTAIGSPTQNNSLDWIQLWYLINPASGSNNVVISANVSSIICGNAASYTGAKQSSQPDAYTTRADATESTTNVNLTTVSDECWAVMIARSASSSDSAAGTGTVRRVASIMQLFDGDSPKTPAGSYTLQCTQTSQKICAQMASFSPSTASSAIKTVYGLAKASVKTSDGLAIASVKTIKGLA